MDQPQLRELEARCIQEEQPFCTAACPIHVDVRAFMAALAKGDLREGRKVLDRTMPFPAILGRLCDQPCRPFCKRGEIGDPLAVGRLEQFCVANTGTVVKLPKLPAKGGKTVEAVLAPGKDPKSYELKLILSREDFFPERVLLKIGSTTVDTKIYGVEKNGKIPAEAFDFKPPKGTDVLELDGKR